MKKQISPGYILTARTLQQSAIWMKPPLYLKCFLWIVLNANHGDVERDGFRYERGELATTYSEIIKALVFYRNRKPIFPTPKEVRNILAWLVSEEMIKVHPLRKWRKELGRTGEDTRKETGEYIGIKIVVVNYDTYQTPENYRGRHPGGDFFELGHNNNNERRKDIDALLVASFERFYSAYPKHKDRKKALNAWKKLNPSDPLIETVLTAIEKQKAEKEALKQRREFAPEWPLPATWLNGRRWEDEVEPQEAAREGWI